MSYRPIKIKLAVWAGLEPAIREFPRRVMEVLSGFKPESSSVRPSHFHCAITPQPVALPFCAPHNKSNKTRCGNSILCREPPSDAFTQLNLFKLALQLRVFQSILSFPVKTSLHHSASSSSHPVLSCLTLCHQKKLSNFPGQC